MSKKHLIIEIFLLVFIFSLFTFLRFYNLDKRIIFDWDQEYLSNFLKRIIVDRDLILIGHRATSDKGFFFGPYFEYLFVPFYIFSKMHPSGLINFIYLLNIIFFFFSYFVIKKIFNSLIALAFLFFWAANYLFITYDTTVWAPVLIPLGIIFIWYSLWRIYNKSTIGNYLLLGLVLGFFTQIHSLFFPVDLFALFFLVGLWFHNKKKFPLEIKKWLSLILAFFLYFTPLFIFDLRHNFLNSKLFISYFTGRIRGSIDIKPTLEVYGNFLKPFFFYNSIYITLIFHFVIFSLLFYLYKKKHGFTKIFYLSSLITWTITTITFLRYNQRPSEYYFIYLYPLITISLIDFFYNRLRLLLIILPILFLLVNFSHFKKLTASSSLGLSAKEKVVFKLKEVLKGKKYNLVYDMPLGLNNGYQYLLEYYNALPSANPKNPLVILDMPAHKNDIVVGRIGIRIPPELLP
ncbi:hypothetical protein HZA76_03550 [Candidatus Roizmanbacteria bacterium]|nr:hypothetical protein [Candidatus Roizmanbacteria bacterium]